MFNVGKSIRTPEEVLYSIEGDKPDSEVDEELNVEVEPGGLDQFEEQENLLAELGLNSREVENDDGSYTVDFNEDTTPKKELSGEFGDNLAESVDTQSMAAIVAQCLQDYEDDRNSRSEWEETLARGLKLLGMSVEERNEPWAKACGIFHPVLLEAVVRGWAKSVKDLSPARGPAKTEIKSKKKGIAKRIRRTTDEVNNIIIHDVPGYAEEQSRLSFMVHLSGSGFKKVYFNAATKKIEDRYVHPLDLIVPYGTTDLEMCPRICHRQMMFPSEVLQLMEKGVWLKKPLSAPIQPQREESKEKQDETSGQKPTARATQREILEFHVDLKIEEDTMNATDQPVPYLIVIDKGTQEILNIRRNWIQDTDYKRKKYFIAYQYITGYSIYGIGMVHLIGGIAEGGTSILRQLVDAGTLANLPAGFKSRGFRVRNDDKPIKPGEWRDVDFPGTRLDDAIMPLPFKEPSVVLAGLLDKMIEEARRTASSIDAAVSDIGKEAPVGSVLAILEESLVIQNSVKVGMLRSLGKELDLIMQISKEEYGQYKYTDDEEADYEADFAAPLRVIPACDPNASSMAQKVVAYREAINTSQTAPPNTYDAKELHRSFLEAMELPNADKIVPLDEDIDAHDPVTEGMRILQTQPVKVFDYQNHEAHVAIHMAAMNDPKIQQIVGQSPNAPAIQAAMAAHVAEHVAYAYRARIEQMYGQALPDPDKPLPAEIDRAIAPQLAQAAQQVLQQSQQEVAQQEAKKLAEDPLVQIKKREVELKEREQERKAIESAGKIDLEEQAMYLDATLRLMEHNDDIDMEKKKVVIEALMRVKEIAANAAARKASAAKSGENKPKNK